MAAMFGLVTVAAVVDVWGRYRLGVHGKQITAEVVRVHEGRDGDGDPRYFPVVAFTPPGGARVQVESPTGKPHPPEVAAFPGGRTTVRYDPSRPERIHVEGYPASGVLMSLLIAVVAGTVTVACVAGMLS
nr:DUF3592 domain-containing protein [Actinomadura kijaniata]